MFSVKLQPVCLWPKRESVSSSRCYGWGRILIPDASAVATAVAAVFTVITSGDVALSSFAEGVAGIFLTPWIVAGCILAIFSLIQKLITNRA